MAIQVAVLESGQFSPRLAPNLASPKGTDIGTGTPVRSVMVLPIGVGAHYEALMGFLHFMSLHAYDTPAFVYGKHIVRDLSCEILGSALTWLSFGGNLA